MRGTKRLRLFLAAAVLVFTCACSFGVKLDNLYGTWTLVQYCEPEDTQDILRSLAFYDSEIALADLNTLGIVKHAVFNENKTYRLEYDQKETYELLHAYFDTLFTTLYENRTSLVPDYGEGVVPLTEDEFKSRYAELCDLSSYDELLELMATNCIDYTTLRKNSEVGTYTARNSTELICKTDGETDGEILKFSIDGDTLTLTYADDIEVYTHSE